MAVELGTGYVSLTASGKGIGDSIAKDINRSIGPIDKEISGLGDNAGKGFSSGFTRHLGGITAALGGVFAGIGIASFAMDMANLGTELEVFDKKVTTVFGDSAADVRAWADRNNEALGMSDEKLAGLAASFGDLLKPMGFTSAEAAEMSKQTLDLSGALSAWTGGQKSAAEVSEILADAMLGETDALKSLGISLSAAEIDAALAAKGQEKLTGAALDQARALATQELIFAKSTDAQAAWANGSMSAIQQQNTLKATVDDLKASVAQGLTPAFQALTSFAVTTLVPALQQVGAWVGENVIPVLRSAADWVRDNVVPGFQVLADSLVQVVIPAVADFADWLGVQLAPVIDAVGDRAQALWPHLQEIGRRIQDDVLPSAKLMWEQFKNDVLPVLKTVAEYIFQKLIPAYLEFQGKIDAYVLPVVARLVTLIGNVIKAQVDLWNALTGMGRAIGDFTGAAKGFLDDLVGHITGLPGRISSAASGMFDGIADAFRSAINVIIGGWNSLRFSIPGFDPPGPGPTFPGFDISTPYITPLASGGVITTPQLALLGETSRARPEIVSPVNMMRDTFAQELDRRGAGATFHQTFVGSDLKARDVAAEIGWELRTLGAA